MMSNPVRHNPRRKTKHFMQATTILAPDNLGLAPQVILHGTQLASGEKTLPIDEPLPLKDSLQIKAAEYWLELGDADQALRELEVLPSRIWSHGWALKTRIDAMGVLRERSEATVQNCWRTG